MESFEARDRCRNDIFSAEFRTMSVALARRMIGNCPGVAPADVTHVATVSCTGIYNPGPDYHIVRELGLSDATQRYYFGFMGCFAASPALRMAAQFCAADLSSLRASAVVNVSMASKYWDTVSGATIWSNSRQGHWMVAGIITNSRGISFSMNYPEDQYDRDLEELAIAVTDNFRPRHEKRNAPK